MHFRTMILTLFLATSLLSGCNTPEGNVADGKRWYSMQNCMSCHGPHGNDGRAAVIASTDLSFGSFISYLRAPDSPSMPPFPEKKLSEQDGADIYAWLKSLPE